MIHLVPDSQQARAMIRLLDCFMNDLLFSKHAPLFLPSSVALSYFILSSVTFLTLWLLGLEFSQGLPLCMSLEAINHGI